MPFKEYTKCTPPSDWHDFSTGLVGIASNLLLLFTTGFLAFLAIAVAGGPAGLIIALAIVLDAIAVLRWYLYGRLICLPENFRNCAIVGMIKSHNASDPAWGKKYGDNDYNMNLLLAPLAPRDFLNLSARDRKDYWNEPQGHLVAENQVILDIPRPYPQTGKDVNHQKLLHIEFEGSGVFDLLNIAYVALFMILGLLAIVILTSFPPVAALLAALFFLLILLGYFLNLLFNTPPGAPGSGNPLAVDPSFGELHEFGDVVVIRGGWIFDSGHAGWNEIHPVRHGQIVGEPLTETSTWADFKFTDPETGIPLNLEVPNDFVIFRDRWCKALDRAQDAVKDGNRTNPEHDWGIHPAVDGCHGQPVIL
jgi:hypothetical protein